MSYTSQTFTDGTILTAAQLNAMDAGITDAEANTVRTDVDQGLTTAQQAAARSNIGAATVSISGTTLVIG